MLSLKPLCKRVVVTIQRHASVEDAARLMRSSHVGDLVVVDADDTRKPVGLFTDRDIALAVVAEGLPAPITPVGLVMSTPGSSRKRDLEMLSTAALRSRSCADAIASA